MSDLLSGLNAQQREAVSTVDGPMLVLAGPGSGKTRVLTHRIAYLIREVGIRPWNILAVTFTNKAAAEMRERVERLLGGRLDGLQIGTFHAICARLLRMEGDHLPYGPDYAIYDTDDQQSLMRTILHELNIDTKKFNPGRVLGAVSQAKNELIQPHEFMSSDYFGEVVRRAYPIYQQRLVNSNAMDFDDLLMQTALLLRDNDLVRDKYQLRYEYVMVDEFQDTNQAQYQLVGFLGAPQNNVFVVGDEDQGIYAFRGADYRNVMQFRRDYPEARVVLLEQNYRSTQVVLDVARAVIDKNPHRTPKALFTERGSGALVTIRETYSEAEEGDFIATTILDLRKKRAYQPRDFAVMYRTNAQSRALEDAFVAHSIPYRLVGGVGFYKRREIKDLMAYLRVINNPNDEVSFRRIINVPGRGIGEKSIATFLIWAQSLGITHEQAFIRLAQGEPPPITGKAGKGLVDFARLIVELRDLADRGAMVMLYDELISRTGYTMYIHEISENDAQVTERMENMNELRGLLDTKKDLGLSAFLEDMALVSDVDTLDTEHNAVTLLTLHSAKGLEFPVVFIPGLEDGILPHSRSLSEPDAMAEERRLLYVGVTRAQDELFLTYAFRRALYGESIPGIPSRFLTDIPQQLTEGISPNMKHLRDAAAYRDQTRWDSGGFISRSGSSGVRGAFSGVPQTNGGSSSSGSSKIIPFGERAQQKPATKYKAGMKVYHSTFGEGTVIDSTVRSGDEEVTIKFEKFGTKLLSAAFAKLEILR